MALPFSRNTTYAPGSQVKSADLNDIQDKIVLLGDHGFFFGDTITAEVGEQEDDFAPAGIGTARHIRLDPAVTMLGANHISGISAAQTDGRRLVLTNLGGPDPMTLGSEDGGSTAANRFLLKGATRTIANNESVEVVYDGVSQRWRLID